MDTRNFTYMFYGFLAAWLILVAYVLMLVNRESSIKKQLADLKNLLEERQQTPARERKGA
jgi:CcmD family protein